MNSYMSILHQFAYGAIKLGSFQYFSLKETFTFHCIEFYKCSLSKRK